MPFKLPKIALSTIAVVGLAGLLSACSSSKKTTASTATSASTAAPTTAAPTPPAPSASPGFTVSVAQMPTNVGLALIGPNGHSLYVFDKDTSTTTSACVGGCAAVWPALKATGTPTAGPGLTASELGASPAGQVTYNNHLLYYFTPDKAPGDTNGTKVPKWHLVSPQGTPMTSA
jgi:predicted lipoprotein with Yx(FWY)xxD motif